MANENVINTRIALKIDTLERWQAIKDTFKPLEGEVCFAKVPTTEGSTLEPIMFKVGAKDENGNLKTWGQLDWASAKAADVYGWAKQAHLAINITEDNGTNDGQYVNGLVWDANTHTFKPQMISFDATIDDTTKDSTNAPQTKAVKKYVDDKIADVVAQGTVVAEGEKITVTQSGNTYTVAHEEIDSPTESAGAGRTYLTGVTTDGYGHITGYTTATEVNQVYSGENAIDISHEGDSDIVKLLINPVSGNVDLTQSSDGLKANIDLNTLVPDIKVKNAEKADTAIKLEKTLKFGNKSFDGSTEQTITASDLGLESAMHFIGAFNGAPATGERKNGDVYLDKNTGKEYVWSNNSWVELGDEGSYALKSVQINPGNGLTGGGSIGTDMTISLDDETIASLGKADTAVQSITEGTGNGTISVDGVDISVHGLGTAAYENADKFKTKQEKVTEGNWLGTTPTYQVVFSIEQDENGVISYDTIGVERIIADEETLHLDTEDPTGYVMSVKEAGIKTNHISDGAISAAKTKASANYTGEDKEVWIFNCGSATTLID